MKRLVWPLLFAAALLFATTAQAQVATTDLLPSAPRYLASFLPLFNGASVTPDNPAALQWGGPSRIVAGTMRLSEGAPASDYSGQYLGGRAVGERWAAALEHTSTSGPGNEETTTSVSLSTALGPLAIGYGYEGYEEKLASDQFTEHTLGGSWRIGDSFYVGFGLGSSDYSDSTGTTTADRSTSMYGLALRTEGDTRWYFAYDVVDKDDFTNGVDFGFVASKASLQVGFGSFVVGVSSLNLDIKVNTNELNATYFDLGWVPEKMGWTIALQVYDAEITGGSPEKGSNVTVGYLF